MTDILTSLAKPDAIAALLVALAVFATVISILLPYLQTDKLETRLKAVTEQREKLRKQSRAAMENKGLRRTDDSMVGNISSKLNLAKALEGGPAWTGAAGCVLFCADDPALCRRAADVSVYLLCQ